MCGCLRARGRRGEERPGAGVVWCVCAGRMRARCVRVWVCRRESLRVSRDPHLPRIARLGYHSRVPVSGVRALTSCCSRPRTSRSVSDVQTWRDCAVRGARGRVGRVDVCTCVRVYVYVGGVRVPLNYSLQELAPLRRCNLFTTFAIYRWQAIHHGISHRLSKLFVLQMIPLTPRQTTMAQIVCACPAALNAGCTWELV